MRIDNFEKIYFYSYLISTVIYFLCSEDREREGGGGGGGICSIIPPSQYFNAYTVQTAAPKLGLMHTIRIQNSSLGGFASNPPGEGLQGKVRRQGKVIPHQKSSQTVALS